MSPEFVIALMRRTLLTALMLAGPLLISGLIIGVAVSILQAVTQIREMTLTFIPKILGVGAVLAIFAPWMLNIIVDYTNYIFATFFQTLR